MISATCEILPSSEKRVTLTSDLNDVFCNPAANLSLDFGLKDLGTVEHARALIRKMYNDLGAHQTVEADITWPHHHIGSCRMVNNATTSVVDGDPCVHGCCRLYVIGSSFFVTGGRITSNIDYSCFFTQISRTPDAWLKKEPLNLQYFGLRK